MSDIHSHQLDEQLPPVLTLEDVQRYLRLGRTKTFELARTGAIPGCRRYGKQWRVVRDVFLAGLAADSQDNPASADNIAHIRN